MTFKTYTLSDPRTGYVRYVGVTTKPLESRLKAHCWASSLKKNDRRSCWVKSLIASGVRPVIEELENYQTQEEMFEGEQFWITQLQALGQCLVNHQDGGRGWQGPRGPMSDSHRAAIGAKIKGKPKAPRKRQHTLNNSAAQGGRPIVDQNGRIFETIADAARELNTSRACIQRILRGKRQSIKSFSFKYAER